jgi:glycolate oxidase FAD binding subunit
MERLDVVIDMSDINQIMQHNSADLTLAVEAGITLHSLRTALAAKGQFLPLDAPLPQRATIGGTLAAGVSGPLKWQYGSARDLVIGMKVAQADGRITQSGGNVVKNVSGYDMARLHVGGLGTLGIITEVSFKLTPLPRQEATLLAQFDSSEDCLEAALGIFNSGVMPIALTTFNRNAAIRARHMDKVNREFALAVRLGGRPRTLKRMENEAFSVIRKRTAQVNSLEDEAAELWSELADFGHSYGEEAMMSARVATLPNHLDKAIEALSSHGNPAIVAQPGYGMMNAHWFGDDAEMNECISDARDAVHILGGSLIVERSPLEVKGGIDVWDYTGKSIETMRRLKAQYDPNGILNPNRFAGGI